jgi:hypothetical protein
MKKIGTKPDCDIKLLSFDLIGYLPTIPKLVGAVLTFKRMRGYNFTDNYEEGEVVGAILLERATYSSLDLIPYRVICGLTSTKGHHEEQSLRHMIDIHLDVKAFDKDLTFVETKIAVYEFDSAQEFIDRYFEFCI